MTGSRRVVAVRVGIALAVAAAGIALLATFVHRADTAAASPGSAPVPKNALLVDFVLEPSAGRVLLCARLQAVAADAAPVIEVLATGGAKLRRPAPVVPKAHGPPDPAAVAADVAIVLPDRSLRQLDAGARGTLVELLGQLVQGRPVAAERVRSQGVDVTPRELAALLEWVR